MKKDKLVTVPMTAQEKEKLRKLAAKDGRSMADYVRQLLSLAWAESK